jgi:UDP-N-acetylbacillosamine N-acetyltransferase
VGLGTVVLPMAVVNTGVTVGEGCIINIGALIDHDCVIENGVHLAPGAIVKAENRIAAESKIESGTVIENRQYPL